MRFRIILFAMVALLATGLSLGRLTGAQRRAKAASVQLSECQRLVHSINTLRSAPTSASLEQQTSQQQTQRIENGAETAKIPLGNLISIDPQPARRVRNTPYSEQPTQIDLRDVTLRQLIVFLKELTTGDGSLHISSLRLSAPRGDVSAEAVETWSTEITLTHVLFSP